MPFQKLIMNSQLDIYLGSSPVNQSRRAREPLLSCECCYQNVLCCVARCFHFCRSWCGTETSCFGVSTMQKEYHWICGNEYCTEKPTHKSFVDRPHRDIIGCCCCCLSMRGKPGMPPNRADQAYNSASNLFLPHDRHHS